MNTWLAVLAVGLGSYTFRVVPLFVPWIASPPPRVERVVTRAGAASLAALAVASIRRQTAHADLPDTTAVVAALVVGLLVARRGARMPTVVLAGIATHIAVGLLAHGA
jgi:branched-subunit amino acid transport protein